jgi:hypothetical protein
MNTANGTTPCNYRDVPITTVYEVDCRICGEAVYPDDRITNIYDARS